MSILAGFTLPPAFATAATVFRHSLHSQLIVAPRRTLPPTCTAPLKRVRVVHASQPAHASQPVNASRFAAPAPKTQPQQSKPNGDESTRTALVLSVSTGDISKLRDSIRIWLHSWVFSGARATAAVSYRPPNALSVHDSNGEEIGIICVLTDACILPNRARIRMQASSRTLLRGERRLARDLVAALRTRNAVEVLYKPRQFRLRAPRAAALVARVRPAQAAAGAVRAWAERRQFSAGNPAGQGASAVVFRATGVDFELRDAAGKLASVLQVRVRSAAKDAVVLVHCELPHSTRTRQLVQSLADELSARFDDCVVQKGTAR